MLDDNGCRNGRIKFCDTLKRGVSVIDIVVGELLALQLTRRRNTRALFRRAIKRRRLMRVFAVA